MGVAGAAETPDDGSVTLARSDVDVRGRRHFARSRVELATGRPFALPRPRCWLRIARFSAPDEALGSDASCEHARHVSVTRRAEDARRSPELRLSSRAHLVDTTLFFSPTSGGVRRYLLAKHAWLRTHARLEHTLVVPGPRDAGERGDVVERRSPLVPFGAGYRFPWRLRDWRDAIVALEPDLVEAGDPYHVGWTAAAAAHRAGVPAVAFCHSDLVALLGGRAGRVGLRAARRYVRALYSRFDRVLAPSRVVVAHLRECGVDHAQVQPLGVDVRTFAPERADPALRTSLGLVPDSRMLVFAGRLAPEKSVGDLLAMAERLGPPYHLVIVGGGERRRPGRNVSFVPYERDPRRLAAWLAVADAHVHAGRCETFGLVTLEAMACGTPAVVCDAGALPEIVPPSAGVVARGVGPVALADAVTALFERPQAPLRAAARSRVVAEYTWDRTLTRQLRAYATLLQRDSLLIDDGVAARA
jgi:alpha-1,6-mannosyltransferase